jgi:hypothetical protein
MPDRHARWGAATGFLFVILSVVAFAGLIGPNVPKLDDPATDWQTYFTDHQDRIQAGVALASVSVFFLIWFLGSVRAALAAAEGGNGRLTSVAYGGGLGMVAFFVVAMTLTAAAAYRPGDLDPNLTRALNDAAILSGGPTAAAIMAFFGATAIVGYRHKAVPAPVAGFCALAAITAPLGFGIVETESGAFAGDGVLGLYLPLLTFTVGFVALSIALYRQAPN